MAPQSPSKSDQKIIHCLARIFKAFLFDKIRRANGPRRVRPCKPPVFAYYCTIIFDNMAPPWGVGWRKCDTRGSVEVPPKFRRSSAEVPSMFPEGSENRAKKSLICCQRRCHPNLWMPFWLHLGSIWPPFLVHFGMISRFSFGIRFRCDFF